MIRRSEELSAKADDLRVRMEKARQMVELFEDRRWQPMAEWLAAEIRLAMNSLCDPDMDPGLTTLIRGQVWTLKMIQSLPAKTKEEIDSIVTSAKGLQDMLAKLHTRRPADYKGPLETVSQITST